jgi:hypothetical protein
MGTVIHAEDKFSDEAFKSSVDFQIWRHDRYCLGWTYDQALQHAVDLSERSKCGMPNIERCERVYMEWLIEQGNEVESRR